MFGFLKKPEIVPVVLHENAEGAKVWMVSWDARYGEFHSDKKRVAKAFFSKEDADRFVDALHAAKKILQYDEILHIKVEEQK